MQYAFHINSDKCITCKACVMACKDKKNLKPGYKFRKVYTVSVGDWQNDAYVYSVSMGCNHCADPACLKVCPVAAITKRASDGIVFINKDACTGCGSCASACPYDVPSLDLSLASPKSDKCDFCRELLAIGQSPVCVASCSMNALDYGDIDQLKSKYPNAVQQVYPIAGPAETNPSLAKDYWASQPPLPKKGACSRRIAPQITPLGLFDKGFAPAVHARLRPFRLRLSLRRLGRFVGLKPYPRFAVEKLLSMGKSGAGNLFNNAFCSCSAYAHLGL